MANCTIEEFSKLEIKVGTIKAAEPVEGSEKLLRLEVDFGEDTRQVLSGVAKSFPDLSSLIGTQAVFVVNLEPRSMMGLESNGMILATRVDQDIILIRPSQDVPAGSKVG